MMPSAIILTTFSAFPSHLPVSRAPACCRRTTRMPHASHLHASHQHLSYLPVSHLLSRPWPGHIFIALFVLFILFLYLHASPLLRAV